MNQREATRRPNVTLRIPREWRTLIAEYLRVPLYRDGYALVLNTGLTSLLGVVYWLVAARKYSPAVLGINSAAISAMMFLSGVAQLNLMSAILRFVPVLTMLRRRFISVCYLVAACASLVTGALFLLGIDVWAPALRAFGSDAGMVAWFVAATVAWSVFNLQDSALTALGAAVFVPAENVVYGAGKIVLLLVLAAVSPHFGIFASWTAALLLSLVPVNTLIFGRFARPRRDTGGEKFTRRDIVRFVGLDYIGAMMWLAASTLMPVIVVSVAGPSDNAYFSLAWMISAPLFAVAASTGAALVVSGAAEPQRVPEYARKVLRQTAQIVIPVAVGLALIGPYALRLFGSKYAHHSALPLALLVIAAIPNAACALYVSIYRVQRRMRRVVTLLAVLCLSVLGVGTILLIAFGIVGVGIAWVVCETLVAAALVALDPGAIGLGVKRHPGGFRFPGATPLLRSARAALARRRNAGAVAGAIPAGFRLNATAATLNDVAVGFATGVAAEEAVVKVAISPAGDRSLGGAYAALSALHADPRLAAWRALAPEPLAEGWHGDRRYIVESRLFGVSVARLLDDGEDSGAATRAAYDAIRGLHESSAGTVTVGPKLLQSWVHAPADIVGATIGQASRRASALQVLTRELQRWLLGREVSAGWIHGDFVPENVLVAPRTTRVTGIVDWERAATPDLAELDHTMFLLAVHSRLEQSELGQVVIALTEGNGPERVFRELPPSQFGTLEELRLLVLLCWLRHVSALLDKSERYRRHPVWKRRNLYAVLDRIAAR